MAIEIGSNGEDIIETGDGNDIIISKSGDDVVIAGDGNDIIISGSGDDLIDAGAGNDVVIAGRGDDEIYGGLGYDLIIAGSGDDIADGGEDDDLVIGNGGDDYLIGGAGSDVVLANGGNDRALYDIDRNVGDWDYYHGGSGYDVLEISVTQAQLDALNLTATQIEDHFNADNADGIVDFSHIDGLAGFDLLAKHFEAIEITVTGGNQPPIASDDAANVNENATVVIDALANDFDPDSDPITLDSFDTVSAQGASISLDNSGNFVYNPTTVAGLRALIDGESTVDSFSYTIIDSNGQTATATVNVTVAGIAGQTITGTENEDNLAGGEDSDAIDGGGGDDNVVAGGGDDYILGGDGNDTIDAGDGNDIIDGGNDNDTIDAGTGNDSVLGGAGDDNIDGGAGNDNIDAGDGNDVIIGGEGDDAIAAGSGDDVYITDDAANPSNDSYDGGDGNDKIQLNTSQKDVTLDASDDGFDVSDNDNVNVTTDDVEEVDVIAITPGVISIGVSLADAGPLESVSVQAADGAILDATMNDEVAVAFTENGDSLADTSSGANVAIDGFDTVALGDATQQTIDVDRDIDLGVNIDGSIDELQLNILANASGTNNLSLGTNGSLTTLSINFDATLPADPLSVVVDNNDGSISSDEQNEITGVDDVAATGASVAVVNNMNDADAAITTVNNENDQLIADFTDDGVIHTDTGQDGLAVTSIGFNNFNYDSGDVEANIDTDGDFNLTFIGDAADREVAINIEDDADGTITIDADANTDIDNLTITFKQDLDPANNVVEIDLANGLTTLKDNATLINYTTLLAAATITITVVNDIGSDAVASVADSANSHMIDLESGFVTDTTAVRTALISNFDNAAGSSNDDVIIENDNDNILTGNGGQDTYTFKANPLGNPDADTITDFNQGDGDLIDLTDYTEITDFNQLTIAQQGADTLIMMNSDAGPDTILLQNINAGDLSAADFALFQAPTNPPLFSENADVLDLNTVLNPNDFSDQFNSGGGDDDITLPDAGTAWDGLYIPNSTEFNGGTGNDTITGGNQADIINGGPGNDTLDGSVVNDFVGDTFVFEPGTGSDTVVGFQNFLDKVDVSAYNTDFATLETVKSTPTPSSVQYDLSALPGGQPGDTILLTNVEDTNLLPSDFIF